MSRDLYTFVGVLSDDKRFKEQAFIASDLSALESYIEQNRNSDTYTTYNLFEKPTSHTIDNIAIVKTIVIDLDNHLSDGFTLDESRALVELLKPHFNVKMPQPKAINFSGRGIHIYIEIEPDTNIQKYYAVSRGVLGVVDYLVGEANALIATKLSADSKAIGPERYIRAPGTLNTKAQAYCTGVYHSGAVYTLDSLIEKYVPVLEPVIKGDNIKSREMLEAYNTNTTWRAYKSYRKEFSALSWRLSAIKDLQTLALKREASDEPRTLVKKNKDKTETKQVRGLEGYRNTMLFIYAVLLKFYYNNRDEMLYAMNAFNLNYTHGSLDDTEVNNIYKSAIKEKYKPYSTKKIISMLDITPDEMSDLKVLIDRTEIKNRTRLRVKHYKQNKARSKQLAKQALIDQVNELRATGASYRAIAKELNISAMTAQRIVKTGVSKLGTIEQ